MVVEEGMTGPEVSLLAITDGRAVARFPAARDYKPIGEGNTGPNTGGMGSVSPVPDIPDALADELIDTRPPAGRRRDGAPRHARSPGVLYAGLMMTPDGPRVLEFNTRFGDPETQALLPRLEDDALALLTAAADGALEPTGRCAVNDGAAVAVVLAAARLPGHAARGRRDRRASRRRPPRGAEVLPRRHRAGAGRHDRHRRRARAGRERPRRQRRRRARARLRGGRADARSTAARCAATSPRAWRRT